MVTINRSTFAPKPQPRTTTPKRAKAPEPSPMWEQLIGCALRNQDGYEVGFPTISLRTSFEQDLARHKYYGVDVDNIESMGRASLEMELTIPFVNGIVPGKHEKWKAGQLYPFVFRNFLEVFKDTRTLTFLHPELDKIPVRSHRIQFEHTGERRDGVIVTAKIVETQDERLDPFGAASPVDHDPSPSFTLDVDDKDIRGLFDAYQPPVFEETFETMMNKLAAIPDRLGTQANLFANKKDQILFRLDRVEQSVKRAKTPILWPVQDAIDRMRDGLFNAAPGSKGRRAVLRYPVTSSTTLIAVANTLRQKIDDLIKLNPNLLSSPEIEPGNVVRYYG